MSNLRKDYCNKLIGYRTEETDKFTAECIGELGDFLLFLNFELFGVILGS